MKPGRRKRKARALEAFSLASAARSGVVYAFGGHWWTTRTGLYVKAGPHVAAVVRFGKFRLPGGSS